MEDSGTEQSVIDALYRISSVVNATDNPRKALEIIIDEIMNVLPASSAAIEMVNPDSGFLEIEVYRGFQRSPKGTSLKIGQGITGWVALHGKPINIGNVTQDVRYIEIDPLIRSELAVPLHTKEGGIMGVVNVDSHEINAFSDHDLKILTLLSSEAAQVVNRIWLIQKLKNKADHLEALIQTGKTIVTKNNLDEILKTIAERSLEIINCKICAIFLFDKEENKLHLKAISGGKQYENFTESLSLNETSIGTTIRRRKTIEVYDLLRTEEHHFLPVIIEEGLESMLSCPIQFEDEIIGVLNVYTDHYHRFNNEEKRLFEALASLGATAIQNARLYERIFRGEETLRKTEKLTTLGLLSAEIAHEIRNPLTVIRLLYESLSLDFDQDDPRSKDNEIISEKLDQLESIVSRVLSFGKSRQEMKSNFDLIKLVEDTLLLMRLKLKQSNIELLFDKNGLDSLWAEVHKGQIQQALLNLIINATQAMPKGGIIKLIPSIEIIENQEVACIRISDTGDGIPEGIKNEIFDSFLTSKPEGTGLGLAIVKRILRGHMGDIKIESTSEAGTTMKIWVSRKSDPQYSAI